jgi:hypothetical protein
MNRSTLLPGDPLTPAEQAELDGLLCGRVTIPPYPFHPRRLYFVPMSPERGDDDNAVVGPFRTWQGVLERLVDMQAAGCRRARVIVLGRLSRSDPSPEGKLWELGVWFDRLEVEVCPVVPMEPVD